MNPNTEREILDEALEAFHQATGVMVAEELRRHDQRTDAEITMRTGEDEWHFRVEIKPWLTRENVGPIVRRIGDDRRRWLLVTRHVTTELATRLRELGLAFIDTDGNPFIDEQGLFIHITGNRPRDKHPGEGANVYSDRQDFGFSLPSSAIPVLSDKRIARLLLQTPRWGQLTGPCVISR